MNIGESHIFSYSSNGSTQALNVPNTGLYQLDLTGASCGVNEYILGVAGGTTTQYIYLEKGTILYVVVGGAGEAKVIKVPTVGPVYEAKGGYNGGGSAMYHVSSQSQVGKYAFLSGGGGATHIALIAGQLRDIPKASVIAVAGGTGGCALLQQSNDKASVLCTHGGGGLEGLGSVPGTQTDGFDFGRGDTGGGGGLYGGNIFSGGSGYLSLPNCVYHNYDEDKVYKSYTATRDGQVCTSPSNGSARITLLRETPSIPKMWLGEYAILDIKLGDKPVNFKQRKVIFDSTLKQQVYDATIDTLESQKFSHNGYETTTDHKVTMCIPAAPDEYNAIYFSPTIDFSLYSKIEISYRIPYKGSEISSTVTLDVTSINVKRYLTFILYQEAIMSVNPYFKVCICDMPDMLYNGAYLTEQVDIYHCLPIQQRPSTISNMHKVTIDKVVAY